MAAFPPGSRSLRLGRRSRRRPAASPKFRPRTAALEGIRRDCPRGSGFGGPLRVPRIRATPAAHSPVSGCPGQRRGMGSRRRRPARDGRIQDGNAPRHVSDSPPADAALRPGSAYGSARTVPSRARSFVVGPGRRCAKPLHASYRELVLPIAVFQPYPELPLRQAASAFLGKPGGVDGRERRAKAHHAGFPRRGKFDALAASRRRLDSRLTILEVVRRFGHRGFSSPTPG